jgi:hypothetical protein
LSRTFRTLHQEFPCFLSGNLVQFIKKLPVPLSRNSLSVCQEILLPFDRKCPHFY